MAKLKRNILSHPICLIDATVGIGTLIAFAVRARPLASIRFLALLALLLMLFVVHLTARRQNRHAIAKLNRLLAARRRGRRAP